MQTLNENLLKHTVLSIAERLPTTLQQVYLNNRNS